VSDYNWIDEYETRCRCSLYIFQVCIFFSYIVLALVWGLWIGLQARTLQHGASNGVYDDWVNCYVLCCGLHVKIPPVIGQSLDESPRL
jgi:hypothetical protein